MVKVNSTILRAGDILKSGVYFYIVVRSEHHLVKTEKLIPCRKLKNPNGNMERINGGKAGFQIYVCSEKCKATVGEMEFLPKEMFYWESDLD